MTSNYPRLIHAGLSIATLIALSQPTFAASLNVANPGFESPAFTDGGYDYGLSPTNQGAHGWLITDGAFVYNPGVLEYDTAGGNGTPAGAEGAQVGGIYGFGGYTISQPLAGPDSIPGNGDDPVLAPATVYALTVAVGQRNLNNQYGVTYGGYEFQLLVGVAPNFTLIGSDADSATPPPGTFIDRTLLVNSDSLDASLYGQPLTILLRKSLSVQTANIDFDNVRLNTTLTPPIGDFNLDLYVSGDDFLIWQRGRGITSGAQLSDGDANNDHKVDAVDLAAWEAHFAFASQPVGSLVPELPAGVLLLVGSCVIFARHRGLDIVAMGGQSRPAMP